MAGRVPALLGVAHHDDGGRRYSATVGRLVHHVFHASTVGDAQLQFETSPHPRVYGQVMVTPCHLDVSGRGDSVEVQRNPQGVQGQDRVREKNSEFLMVREFTLLSRLRTPKV